MPPDKGKADPTSIRLNEPDVPDRAERFRAALSVGGGDRQTVLRELVDGYIRCVEERGFLPSFPLLVASEAESNTIAERHPVRYPARKPTPPRKA